MPAEAPHPGPAAPTPPSSPTPPPAAVAPRPRRRLSPVWIVPLVAALVGLWLVYKHYSTQGPEVTVTFETAEGLAAGKTLVLCRSVDVGTVAAVRLRPDLKGVVATLQMNHDADALLRRDTQFWVVRPRFGGAGVSGLNTLVSGSYLEVQPGVAAADRRAFVGLEQPPVTPPGVPGLHVKLVAQRAGSLNPGSPIVYKGINVGRIESRTFSPETGEVEFGAFVDGDYGRLVDRQTVFWNYSGVDVQVGAEGVKLRTGTLESILAGGVTFSEPAATTPRAPAVADGTTFALYDSFEEARKPVLNPTLPYLLLFSDSVRGLNPEAPVEFRGIRIGSVVEISFRLNPDDPEHRVPVLIRLDPLPVSGKPGAGRAAVEREAREQIARDVAEHGLRASLKTGNLLTGQLFVDVDYQKDAPPAPGELPRIGDYAVLPTTSGGLGQLQEKVTAFLDKLQSLPLDQTVGNANSTLAAVRGAVTSLDQLVGSKETRALPGDLRGDLTELRKTLAGYNDKSVFYQDLGGALRSLDEALRSFRGLTGTLDRNPNAILFGKPGNVPPPRGSGR